MAEGIADQFYTSKHKRLLRIAVIANIFVWIVIVVNTLLVLLTLWSNLESYVYSMQGTTFWEVASQDPLHAPSLFINLLNDFIKGLVYALVLKGISLGLNMIVEIDLNQKGKVQGAANE